MRATRRSQSKLVVPFLMCVMLGGLLLGERALAGTEVLSIPELALWEAHMKQYGKKHCARMVQVSASKKNPLGYTFYDGERVYRQIRSYTGDPWWKRCERAAMELYRDGYVFPRKGGVNGYSNFTLGLRMGYEQTGETRSRDAVLLMARSAAYAKDWTPLKWTSRINRSREVAYVVMNYVNAEALGGPVRPRKFKLIDQALEHIDQWFVSQTAEYMQPFMVGLTLQALIQANEASPDPRIPPAVATALDGLWDRTWLPEDQAFMYMDRDRKGGSKRPASDLNLLIAPAYAWMYLKTGDAKYRDRGDQVFAGGVKRAHLQRPKHFNQNYMWSFDYVNWRQSAAAKFASRGTAG